MILKQYISNLRNVQSVINSISNVEVWANGATGLLNANSLNSLKTAISGLSKEQALLVLSTKNLTQAQTEQVLVEAGIIASNDKINASIVQRALAESTLTAEQQKDILTKLELVNVETGEVIATNACTKAALEEALAKKGIVGADAEAIISSMGLTSANATQTISFDLLTASIWANIKALGKWLVTNPIGWAILGGTAIFGLVKAYDALTDSTEEVKERTDALLDSYNSAISEANSNAKTIESLASRYETLSKGVNNLGENVSLTADEYSEYNDIVNQIAEMFPTMITGYTDEGNAILSLKGNVEELRDAYKEAQKEAYNLLIVSGKDNDGNDIITNYRNQLYGNSKSLTVFGYESGAKDVINILTRLQEASNPEDFVQVYRTLMDSYIEKNLWATDKIQDALNSSGISDLLESKEFSWDGALSQITQEDLDSIKYNIQSTIQTYQAEIDSQLQNVRTIAYAYLMTNEDYAKLGEQSKTAASLLVNSIDESIANGFENKSDVGAYVAELITSISNNAEAQKALTKLFTMDTTNMIVGEIQSEVDSYVSTIATAIGEDPVELKVRLGFDDTDTKPLIENVKKKLKGTEFDDKVGELNLGDLKIAADLEVDDDTIQSWDDLIERIEKVKSEGNETDIPATISSSVSQIATQLEPQFEKLGEAYRNIFTEDGFTLDNVDNSMLEELRSAFEDIEEEVGVAFDATQLNDFFDVLTDSESTASEVQQAFDDLATSYFYSTDTLNNLNSATAKSIAKQLEAMGVTNASTVVTEALKAKEQALAVQNRILSETGETLADVSVENYNKFLAQAGASKEARAYLFELIAEERVFSNTDLGASEKAAELMDLANAYGQTALAASIANALAYAGGIADWDTFLAYQKQKLKESLSLGLDYKAPKTPSSSNKDNKDSDKKEETKETFDFIETALERISAKVDELKGKAEETFRSFKSRGKAYADGINKITEEINLQQQAYDAYMARANSIGLDEQWAQQVRDGSINIADISDETLKQQIKDYEEWYEKARECKEEIKNLEKEQQELVRANIELLVTKYDKLISKVESANNRIENNIDLKEAWGGSASIKDYNNINKNNVKQIRYYNQQNTELKNLQKTVTKGSEAWYEYQEQIDSNNESIQDLKASMVETAKAAASLAAETAEIKIEKYGSKNELIDAKIDNTVSTKKQNSFIDTKIDNIQKQQKAYDDAVATDKKNISKAKKTLNNFKSTKENKKLLSDIKKYTKAGKKIPQSLLKKANALKDNGKLYKACIQYNAYIDAYNTDKEAADLFAQTSKQDIADLELEKFNNIEETYDNSIYKNDQKETAINNEMSENKLSGKKKYNVNEYKKLVSNEKGKLSKLKAEKKKLQDQLDKAVSSGRIKEGSDEWWEMVKAIDAVANAIDESTASVLELKKSMEQLNWELFDDALEKIKRINSESDYYIDMMDYQDLIDEENGELTDYGNATLALHNTNYETYLAQAEEYGKEYNDIMKKIKKGELSATDDDVIARLRELEDARRDCMLSAEAEKKAIIDLLQSAYDKQLDAISDLISKYKDLLKAEQDAYEYQRTIEEKVKNIASLQKMLGAYTNNADTEENRARIQQIKLELEEAQQDLKDTQYEKYVSDTNDMLDDLYDKFEEFLDDKMNDTNAILEEIRTTLGTDYEKVIQTLLSVDGNLTSILESLLTGKTNSSDYAEDTVNDGTTVITPKTGLQKPTAAELSAYTASNGMNYTKLKDTKKVNSLYNDLLKQREFIDALTKKYSSYQEKSSNAKNAEKKKEYRNLMWDIENQIAGAQKLEQNLIDQLIKLGGFSNAFLSGRPTTETLIPQISKGKGYAKGTKSAVKGIHLTDEEGIGSEVIITKHGALRQLDNGDHVFNADMSENLWKLAQVNPEELMRNMSITPITTAFPTFERNVGEGDVNVSINELTLPNVTNYEEFRAELIKDNKFEKAVQSMSVGRGFGDNSLSKYRFK